MLIQALWPILAVFPICCVQDDEASAELADRVHALVRQLDDEDAQVRAKASDALQVIGPSADIVLAQLFGDLTPRAQQAIEQIRAGWSEQQVKELMQGTKVTIVGKYSPEQALAQLSKQSDIAIQVTTAQTSELDFEIREESFFRALDSILQQSNLWIQRSSSATGEIHVGAQPVPVPGIPPRCYDGPFRIEVRRSEKRMDYSFASASNLAIVLGMHWEPRLKPIAILRSMKDIEARDEAGGIALEPKDVDSIVESRVQPESNFVEFSLPFQLAGPEVTKIAHLSGTLKAIVPGSTESIQFEALDESSANLEQRRHQLVVRLEEWKPQDSLYSVRIRLKYDQASTALDSFRSWINYIQVTLEDGMGTTYKSVGREITRQADNEIGMRIIFAQSPETLNLVVRAPSSLLLAPIHLDLRDIILP